MTGIERHHVRRQRDRAGREERQKRRDSVPGRAGLFFGEVFGRPSALVRTDAQIVPDTHGKPVGKEVGGADDEHGARRERPPCDAGDDGKCGDDAVVGAVDHIADVVPGDLDRTSGFAMK